MNLRTIPHLRDAYGVPVGLSDHTVDVAVPAAAVALGACIVEKHFTASRATPGPDSAFSLEPAEFRAMARDLLNDPAVRETLRQVLTDPDNRNFGTVWKAVADRAFGPVVQRVKVKATADVRGVILLPAPAWGAPQPQGPQVVGADTGAVESGGDARHTLAPPLLHSGALDSIADAVADAVAAAAAADADGDTP
jgi:hypothetical protein